MAQIPKGTLVKGPYKPICRDCAIYFSITVRRLFFVAQFVAGGSMASLMWTLVLLMLLFYSLLGPGFGRLKGLGFGIPPYECFRK